MSERDLIVHVCACDVWDERPEGCYHIPGCGQKIQAVNISRLLRTQEATEQWPMNPIFYDADMRAHNCDGSCADWDAECGGGCDE
jgi:hypothetical protein